MVAALTGYASEFAFNRGFKREYGISPGTYRRREPAAVRRGTDGCPADGLTEKSAGRRAVPGNREV
ncbi:AraC family transcriptional regulator [Streptosporangium sp. 'caverna']|uniref:AraC family transcriptional regulator n=1 Tax=Streptosporangium sp. 'caverna' TaxID=2202249 RepID=UPI001EF8B38F|nr:AraC family transcriptional regulator [Streptosporangium sp. 'caverna']